MSDLVKFSTGTYAAYTSSTKDSGTLFYTTDTEQLFKGSTEYTKSAKVVSTLPTIAEGIYGVIYINTTTNTPYVFNGTYIPMIKSYSTTIGDTSDDTTVPTSKAVKDYVQNVVDNLDVSSGVDLSGYVRNATYASATRTIVLPMRDSAGTDTTLTIELGKDIFVESGTYNETDKTIELTLTNGEELTIPVSDLIEEFVISGSDSVTVETDSSSGTKTYTISSKISSEAGNSLSLKSDGLYVTVPDNSLVWNEVTV